MTRNGPLVVVGDVLLDHDVTGRATRLCPDGAGPVVERDTETWRAGGAGLAATIAAHDGRDVVLVTPLANDEDGRQLRRQLPASVEVVPLPAAGSTPVKTRIRAGGQTVARVDHGGPCRATGDLPDDARRAIVSARGVLVSDYGGGTTSLSLLRQVLSEAAQRVSVTWDPHRRGARPVPGTRVVTPNLAEALALSEDLDRDEPTAHPLRTSSSTASVEDVARGLASRWRVAAVAVTTGADGAVLAFPDGAPLVVPAPFVSDGDTCGAGDRFASAVANALVDGAVIPEAVGAAVAAASAYVNSGGPAGLAAPLSEDVGSDPWAVVAATRRAGGTVVATGGCFDLLHAGHVNLLHHARRLGDCLIVLMNSDASVSRLKGVGRPLVGERDRAEVLQSLRSVDGVIVFEQDTPIDTLRELRPDVWVKGGDYGLGDLAEAPVVESWGGRTMLVPYRDGRSTTQLIASAVAKHTSLGAPT